MKKRLFSFLLALALVLTIAPTIALTTAEAASADVTIIAANFPDNAFRSYVADTFDTDVNGILSASEITAVTEDTVPAACTRAAGRMSSNARTDA